jgi:hypothetical protein
MARAKRSGSNKKSNRQDAKNAKKTPGPAKSKKDIE